MDSADSGSSSLVNAGRRGTAERWERQQIRGITSAARLQDDQDDERWSIPSPVGWNSELEVLGIIEDSIDEDANDSWRSDKLCGVLDYDAKTVNGIERWGPNRQRGDAGELDDD